MISSIGFKNYKAFASGEMTFKPITILLGANSVGKSSIIQLMLMLLQSATDKADLSALKTNGEIISSGNIANLFRGRNTAKPIELSIELDAKYTYWLRRNPLESIYKQLDIEHRQLERMGYNDISQELKGKNFIRYIAESEANFEKVCNLIDRAYTILGYPYLLFRSDNVTTRKKEYLISYQIVKKIIREVPSPDTRLQCRIELGYNAANRSKTNILYISQLSIEALADASEPRRVTQLLGLQVRKPLSNPTVELTSDVLNSAQIAEINEEFHRHKKQIVPNVRRNIFSYFTTELDTDFLFSPVEKPLPLPLEYTMQIFQSALQSVEKEFEIGKINYVSPLRAHPKRYYYLDKTKTPKSLDTLNGDSIAEVLKNNSELKDKVNAWLKHFQIAIDVHIIEEAIHKLKVQQNKLELDITDVGFGISQILPVIVQGFFTPDDSLTMIEQPEVHLHPKMQADLADLFIDIALPQQSNRKGRTCQKYLLIETHSEYLLKRLRRRIADKTISADDVAIYYIEQKENNRSTISAIDISRTGLFEWPEEFYGGELLKDTLDFLKLQN